MAVAHREDRHQAPPVGTEASRVINLARPKCTGARAWGVRGFHLKAMGHSDSSAIPNGTFAYTGESLLHAGA